ncbi:MAG: class F420-dependent oxidoreductase [Acidimicrobiales bacterium]|nr:class F420-dependent oxidoreductase [Acidimicrobiales bacterium]
MSKPLKDETRALIDRRNPAHLSTLMPDGHPKVEPVWIGREGDRLLITSDRKAVKSRNLAADPRVGFSIVDAANPYEQVLLRGRVVEERPDEDLAVLDALSQKYLGRAFPRRSWSGRVVFVIEVEVERYYRSPLADLVVEPEAPA